MIIKEVEVKTAISKSNIPGCDYCVNPYVGCSHSCLYCYAQSMPQFSGSSRHWGQFVDVRKNIVDVLRREIPSKSIGRVMFGTVTDCYQPQERKYCLTRQCLELFKEANWPVTVLTKSALVVRDIDIFTGMKDCSVGLSINTIENKYRKVIEPGADSIERRLSALKQLTGAGLDTYAFIAPVIPGVTNLEALLNALSGRVKTIYAEALNIRGGNLLRVEYALRKSFPEVCRVFSEQAHSLKYWKEQEELFYALGEAKGFHVAGFFRH